MKTIEQIIAELGELPEDSVKIQPILIEAIKTYARQAVEALLSDCKSRAFCNEGLGQIDIEQFIK